MKKKLQRFWEKNYCTSSNHVDSYKVFKPKHLPRIVNKNKTIAIEPHSELLSPKDRGVFNSNHSHRSIYDIYKLDCKKSLTVKNINKDIFIKQFFLTTDEFKIFDIPIASSLSHNCSGKLLIQLFFNTELRRRALIKIRIHYHHKNLLNYIYR